MKIISWKPISQYATLLAMLLIVVMVGCDKGPPTGTLKGNVTLDGEPYTGSALIIIDAGQGASVNIQEDGTFEVEDPLLVGTYKVYLAPPIEDLMAEEAKPTAMPLDVRVPAKYKNESSTDIEINVVEGENDVLIDLKK